MADGEDRVTARLAILGEFTPTFAPHAATNAAIEHSCAAYGLEMDLRFVPGSRVGGIYGAAEAREQYYCNFGVNSDCVPLLSRGPLRVVGSDAEGEVRVVELPGHPFFIGTLFVPQALSRASSLTHW